MRVDGEFSGEERGKVPPGRRAPHQGKELGAASP